MDVTPIQSALMADVSEYFTVEEAVADPRVPYTPDWVKKLLRDGTVEGRKFGKVWAVHLPSLLAYIEEMDRLGTKKYRK